jgi:peptidoglycan/LPS O-acetylase OafA/YrhL
MIHYRRDVDGLRAVAVLYVLLFHAEIKYISGGFIGVDVFFVISGYLITSMIHTEIEKGEFSLMRFYERRIRRIIPALMSILLFSLIAGWFLFLPAEFEAFGRTLAAASAFASNIVFYREAGYFDLSAFLKPLLHTWSLSVEEQFYICFPLCMIIIKRFLKSRFRLFMTVGLLTSFAASILLLDVGQNSAAFYLLPTRAWELLVGSLLALGAYPKLQNERIHDLLSITGLALVLFGGLYLTRASQFPGPSALYPTVGTALIIYTGILSREKTLVSRLLGQPLFVFIGKISYSLYLWHWPLFVFVRYYLIMPLTQQQTWAMIGLSFVLATLSWKFVEQPFRSKERTYPRKPLFASTAVISVLLGVAGFTVLRTHGVPQRFDEDIIKMVSVKRGVKFNEERFGSGVKETLGQESNLGATFLVWGDSHANALAPAFHKIAVNEKVAGILLKQAGCMPTSDVSLYSLQSKECIEFNKKVLVWLKDQDQLKKVVLIAQWSGYPRGWADEALPFGTEETRQKVERGLRLVLGDLKKLGKRVYVVGEVPSVEGYYVPSVLARSTYYGRPLDIRPTLNDHLEAKKYIFPMLEKVTKEFGVALIYPHKALCDERACELSKYGYPLYVDDNHLSTFGAELISDTFLSIFRESPAYRNRDRRRPESVSLSGRFQGRPHREDLEDSYERRLERHVRVGEGEE